MNFKEYLLSLYPYSEKSLQEKERQLRLWQSLCLQGQQLEDMDSPQLLRLAESLRSRYTAVTMNNLLRTLEQYYRWLVAEGIRAEHPLYGFRIQTDKKPILRGLLTEDELSALYTNYSDKGHYGGQFDVYRRRNKAMLGLMAYQALDSGSLRALTTDSLELGKAIIHVPRSSAYKLEARTLPLEAVQVMELYRYLNETRPALLKLIKAEKGTTLLFPTAGNTKFSSVTKIVRRHLGIKDPLLLRNSRIGLWMKRYNIRRVQYMAGYKTLMSLEKFNAGKIEQLRQAIDKYHPL